MLIDFSKLTETEQKNFKGGEGSYIRRFTGDEACTICQTTLQNGDGEPLPARIEKMLAAFKTHNVTQAMIEAKLKRPRTAWSAGDLAELTTTFQSLERHEITTEESFPQAVSVDDLVGQLPQEVQG